MRMTAAAMERRHRVLAALQAAQNFVALAEASFNAGNHPRFQLTDLDDAEKAIASARSLLS